MQNKKSLCPLGCMGRRKKANTLNSSDAGKIEIENHDLEDHPRVSRICSGEYDTCDIDDYYPANISTNKEDESDDEFVVEEVIAPSKAGQIEGAVVVPHDAYGEINKPTRNNDSSITQAKSQQFEPPVPPKHVLPSKSHKSDPKSSVRFDDTLLQQSSNFGSTGNSVSFGNLMADDVSDDDIEQSKQQNNQLSPNSGPSAIPSVTAPQVSSRSSLYTAGHNTDVSNATESYKKTIQKLSAELSRAKANETPRSLKDSSKLLPGKGPVPPWLTDLNVIAPLYAALEEQIEVKDRQLEDLRFQLSEFKKRADLIERENKKLRSSANNNPRLSTVTTTSDNVPEDWQEFVEQSKILIEENQVLLRHLHVSQDKVTVLERTYNSDMTSAELRNADLETTTAKLAKEKEQLQILLNETKQRCDLLSQELSQQNFKCDEKLIQMVRELDNVKHTHHSNLEMANKKLETMELENMKMKEMLVDQAADKERLEAKVESLTNLLKEAYQKQIKMQSESKKCVALKQRLDISQNNNLSSDQKIRKMEKLMQSLLKVLGENETSRDELNKEVVYLRSLLKEKTSQMDAMEHEQGKFEEQLESIWQVAS